MAYSDCITDKLLGASKNLSLLAQRELEVPSCPKKQKGCDTMKKTVNLQDLFLTRARRESVPLTVFLVNGFQMRGVVRGFDPFVVVLESEGRQQMIYKHAISTVAPVRNLDLHEAGEEESAD